MTTKPKSTPREIPGNVPKAFVQPQDLLNRGYKIFYDSMQQDQAGYCESYQKRFDDQRGQRYFLNVQRSFICLNSFQKEYISFSLHYSKNGAHGDINYSPERHTIEQIETFFEEMWLRMSFDYYETYDGSDEQLMSAHEELKRADPRAIICS